MKPESTLRREAAHTIEMERRKQARNFWSEGDLPNRNPNRRALRGMAARERTREDVSDEATTNFHRLPRRDWYKLHGKANRLKRERARLRRAYQYEQVAALNEQVWINVLTPEEIYYTL